MLIRMFLLTLIILPLAACLSGVSSDVAITPSQATLVAAAPEITATTTPVPMVDTAVPTEEPTPTEMPTSLPSPTEPPTATATSAGALEYAAYYGGQPAGSWDVSNYRAYQADHPGLDTGYYGFSIYTSPVPRPIYGRLTREETADVFSSFIVGELTPYVDDGLIADISDVWQEQGWSDVFPQSVQDYVTFDGGQYFVPQAIQWNPIWYRTDLFEEVGITPPETWEQFLDNCEALHAAGFIPVTVSSTGWTPPLARWFTILNLRLNGPDFHEALMHGEASYTDPRVRDVFAHWQEMFMRNCFAETRAGYGEAANQIYNGEAAMYNLGEWLSESYGEGLPEAFAFFSMPVMNVEVPRAEIVHMYGAFLHANAANPEEARDFLIYLGNVESQTSNVTALNRLVANTAVDQTLYNDIYRDGLDFVAEAETITQLYELNTHPDVAEAGLRAFSDFFGDPSDETIEEILLQLEAKRVKAYGDE